MEQVLKLCDLLGRQGLGTFMCNSVAARLGDSVFMEQVLKLYHLLGPQGLVTLMRDSLVARLLEPGYVEFLKCHHARMPQAKFMKIMRLGGIAARWRVLRDFMENYAGQPDASGVKFN